MTTELDYKIIDRKLVRTKSSVYLALTKILKDTGWNYVRIRYRQLNGNRIEIILEKLL
jgi:hypothetical protein